MSRRSNARSDRERDAPTERPAQPTPLAWVRGPGRSAGGIVLIAFGVLGLVLPIVPGIPLLIAGVALLGPKHPLIRPLADRLARWRQHP
jgi:hypothetical protein